MAPYQLGHSLRWSDLCVKSLIVISTILFTLTQLKVWFYDIDYPCDVSNCIGPMLGSAFIMRQNTVSTTRAFFRGNKLHKGVGYFELLNFVVIPILMLDI